MNTCDCLTAVDWLAVTQAIAAVLAVYVAFAALHTWKHQSKAQKQTDYLDELTDTVHEYIQTLASPIEILKIIYLGIESHRGMPTSKDYEKNSHVIAYIERRGKEDSEKLWAHLKTVEPLAARVKSLVARGQVYGFKNFPTCVNSIRMLLWQVNRLHGFAAIVGNSSWNWDNAEVIKTLEQILTVEPGDIETHLQKYNAEFLGFVGENYRQIYDGT